MDIYDSIFSEGYVLNEQVARQVFDTLPEKGPIVIIMDRDGNYWPSNSEEFSKLSISEAFLGELRSKIDDGAEPVITQVCDTSITAAQLATERTNCGYVIIALQRYNPESTLVNIDLIETLLNQITLIAKLVEKNNILLELQMKHFSIYGKSEAPSN
jgi:hypothetical protein